jgi:hypothetical protein
MENNVIFGVKFHQNVKNKKLYCFTFSLFSLKKLQKFEKIFFLKNLLAHLESSFSLVALKKTSF